MSARKTAEVKRPFTVEDHREQDRIHVAKKTTAVSDALKFPNGDQFEADLTEIFSSDAESSGEIIAIALTDCDKFDHINSDFGLEEGDRVLIEAGKYIRDSLPEGAKVYRIGGDEFAIFMRNINAPENAVQLANRLSNQVKRAFKGEKLEGRVTLSIGVAVFPDHGRRFEELFKAADAALYHVKNHGRAAVAVYVPGEEPGGQREL